MRTRPRVALDLARTGDVECPQARALCLGDVKRSLVGRQTDAIGRHEGMRDLLDGAPVRRQPVYSAVIELARAALTGVAEPDAAVAVEHQVVRSAQVESRTGGRGEHGDRAVGGVDALDPAARVVVG